MNRVERRNGKKWEKEEGNKPKRESKEFHFWNDESRFILRILSSVNFWNERQVKDEEKRWKGKRRNEKGEEGLKEVTKK